MYLFHLRLNFFCFFFGIFTLRNMFFISAVATFLRYNFFKFFSRPARRYENENFFIILRGFLVVFVAGTGLG